MAHEENGYPVLIDNDKMMKMCEKYRVNYLLIEDEYQIEVEL